MEPGQHAIVGVLVALDGPDAGQRVVLKGAHVVGHGLRSDGTREDGAILEEKGPGRFVVKELGTGCELYVNDERVAQSLLVDQAFLRVGAHTYRFFLESQVEATPVPVAPPAPSPAARARRPGRSRRRAPTGPAAGGTMRDASRGPAHGSRRRPDSRRKGPPLGLWIGAAAVAVVVIGGLLLAFSGSSKEDGQGVPVATTKKTVKEESRPRKPETIADVVAEIEGSVALVSSPAGFGTGFMVGDGVLATNAHVIRGAYVKDLRVQYPSRGAAKSEVEALVHLDNRRDLCLLRVAKGPKPLRLAGSVPFRRGEEVLLIGNPGVGDEIVLENAVTQGLMSAVTKIEGEEYVQISASVNPGNSGGPVLNRKGEVLCVTTLKGGGGVEGIAFGIPVTDVWTALRRAADVGYDEELEMGALHDAETAFLKLSRTGGAYATAMYINVQAMKFALGNGVDPSAALWAAKREYESDLRYALGQIGSGYHEVLREASLTAKLDRGLQAKLDELVECVEKLTEYVEHPEGRVDTYLTTYELCRVRLASLISQVCYEFAVDDEVGENLPPQR